MVGVMRMAAQQKDIRFVYEADTHLPAGIECDQKRLRQVLLNLLGNAVKFTESGGTVTFSVTHLEKPTPCPSQEGNSGISAEQKLPSWEGQGVGFQSSIANLRFSIQDTGVGMTADQLKMIFKPFEQVGDTQKRAEGTGLGLAITRQLVTLMGGEIQVESALGYGSTFWFEIPVPVSRHDMRPMPQKTESRYITGYEGRPRTILVVDDRPENHLVLLNLLTPLGFQVLLAEDGQQGFEQARTHRPALILTDLIIAKDDWLRDGKTDSSHR